MDDLPLSKIISYPSMKLNKAHHAAYEEDLNDPTIEVVSQNELIGIEIEMENMPSWADTNYYWSAKKDGSLRNYGVEYVSIPLRACQIEWALNYLEKRFEDTDCNPDFSSRTSTHIHLNVRDITKEQHKNLVLLYAMFEKHFFKFAEPDREKSLFCVPLYATYHMQRYERMIDQEVSYWSKYLALNILPTIPNDDTGTYGTVEFRHLHGTMDPYKIVEFVNSILCLKQEAKKWKHVELLAFLNEANSTSAYNMLYHQIFGKYVRYDLVQDDFESCISHVKKNIFKNVYRDTLI